jgi:protein-L-isoaspartate(D-aspartate) O-methyltransferase
MTINECRRFYADEIKLSANLHSEALVAAFARVPREKFLGPGPWDIASPEVRGMSVARGVKTSYTRIDDPRDVYHNVVVALDKSADINNGQPSALARWIEALDLKPGCRAYHLGCGVGYYTAIMAEMVGPGGSIIACEVHPDLALRAKQNLSEYPTVSVVEADGATFDPGECDAMLINAGVTHPSPLWLNRLCESGCTVVPITISTTPTIGMGFMMKVLCCGRSFSAEIVTSLAIYSCTGARDPQLEPKLKTAMGNGSVLKMKSVRTDPHEEEPACLIHGAQVCISSREAAA